MVGNHLSGVGFNPGVCESLAERLRRRDWRVRTTSHHAGRMARLCDMLGTVWRERHEYDLAHVDVYSGRAFLWAEAVCRLLRLTGKPYVVTLRGGNLARFARRYPRRITNLLSGAAAVTTPSRFLFEHFGSANPPANRPTRSTRPMRPTQSTERTPCRVAFAQLGSTDPPINRLTSLHLIPNPIDVEAYRYRPRKAVEPHLIWLRAFHRIYQPELAVTVLAEIVRDFPAARLTMVGPDKGDGSLACTRRMAERRGLARRIDLPGAAPKSSLPALLDRGDIFLNTSQVDNTPVSVLEAMAGGLCIVSTNAGGLPYLLRHECDALLTTCGHPAEMVAAVRRFLHEPALAEQLSRNARRNVAPYDWSVVLPIWERLFFTTAERRAI
jgi:glycosyltransferase involved in cell wall biosynthesis